MSEFADTFSNNLGKTTLTKHEIHPEPDTRPIRLHPYRVSSSKSDAMKKEIDEMLRLGVIEPSSSPWSAPVVLIPKPDNTLRFCVDYRRLNEATVPDAFPMPVVEKEAIALILATHTFFVYLDSKTVTVYSDHSPLQFLHRMANHNHKLLRRALELQQYTLRV